MLPYAYQVSVVFLDSNIWKPFRFAAMTKFSNTSFTCVSAKSFILILLIVRPLPFRIFWLSGKRSRISRQRKRTVGISTVLFAWSCWAVLSAPACAGSPVLAPFSVACDPWPARTSTGYSRLRPRSMSSSLPLCGNEKRDPHQVSFFSWSCWADLNCRTSSLPRKRSTDWATTAYVWWARVCKPGRSFYLTIWSANCQYPK